MSIDPDTPILIQEHPECVTVSFLSDTLLDFEAIQSTGAALDRVVAENDPPNLVLVMPNVRQLSSMMISVLIRTQEGCKARGGITKLANLSDRVNSILEMAAIKPIFDVYDTEDAARASF